MQDVLKVATSARSGSNKSERACIEVQNAIQWLARMTRSYAQATAEGICLAFDPAARRAITPEVAPGIRLGLQLPGLILQFEEDGRPTSHPLDLDDKSSTEVEAWLLAELLHRGFDRDRFDKRLPYDWPHAMSGDELKYSPHELAAELHQLTESLVAGANSLIQAKNDAEAKPGAQASAGHRISLWPDSCGLGFSRQDGVRLKDLIPTETE